MRTRRRYLTTGLALMAGVMLGWLLAGAHPRLLLADSAGRRGESALIAAAIATQSNPQGKIQLTNDGLFYLNYSRGKLYAAYPQAQQQVGRSQFISEFAERDLVDDFHLRPGSTPHFLCATGFQGALSEGWAALYVFETTTGQVAIYRIIPQARAGNTRPMISLVERRDDPRLAEYKTAQP